MIQFMERMIEIREKYDSNSEKNMIQIHEKYDSNSWNTLIFCYFHEIHVLSVII